MCLDLDIACYNFLTLRGIMLKIEVVYCAVWHYTDRAVSLEKDLLKEFEHLIESVTLIPSDGGRFEVTVNGTLIYSKLQTKRHAEPGEVVGLIGKMVQNQ